jgi:hypothetical protein
MNSYDDYLWKLWKPCFERHFERITGMRVDLSNITTEQKMDLAHTLEQNLFEFETFEKRGNL